jgi:DNA polymerase-4
LIRLQNRIWEERSLTVSVGLSYNKFLAKTASDLDKPRGFSVIGRAEALAFLEPRAVATLPGVGPANAAALERNGLKRIGDIRAIGAPRMRALYGDWGAHLFHLSMAEDHRRVDPDGERKSISAETTFDVDLADFASLRRELWPLCEKVSARMKSAGLEGRGVTLKLKTASFKLLTRAAQLDHPTQLADALFRAAEPLLRKEAGGTPFRLIGIGLSHLGPAAGDQPDLFEPKGNKRARVERAMDAVREKLGKDAIATGRGIKS